MDFSNKVVIVTGAGSGIGKAVAIGYAFAGAKVIIAEIDPNQGLETERYIKEKGYEACFVKTDVKTPSDVEGLIHEAVKKYSTVDILINNAGVSKWISPYEISVEEWDDIININLRGMFLCAREAAKIMKAKGGGAIVNISSTRAFMSEPNSEAYAASKGGIVSLTHALAISLGADKIRVNAISPGWIETGSYQDLREIDHIQHPSKRVGMPADVVRACFFLTAVENDFITGTNLMLDGGMTKKMIYEP